MLRVDQYIAEAVDKANDKYHEANVDIFRIWKSDMVFTWHWWMGVALSVLPWILWVIVRKKESTNRLLLAGLVVLIISSFLDTLGMALRYWDYSTKVIPLIPPFFPWDFTLMPVVAMLFYQFKPNWNPYLKAAVFSAIGSFVVQPVFEWTVFYEKHQWADYYSFPIMFVIYLAGYYFIKRKHYDEI
jgi:hypothetical protein